MIKTLIPAVQNCSTMESMSIRCDVSHSSNASSRTKVEERELFEHSKKTLMRVKKRGLVYWRMHLSYIDLRAEGSLLS